MAEESTSLESRNLGYDGCKIFRARRIQTNHAVRKWGRILTLAEATVERQSGRDIVVCGEDGGTNRLIAERIESAATNRCHKFNAAHVNRGSQALPHYQHRTGKIAGHAFYESPPSARAINGGASP